jgi:hypothetical protein
MYALLLEGFCQAKFDRNVSFFKIEQEQGGFYFIGNLGCPSSYSYCLTSTPMEQNSGIA